MGISLIGLGLVMLNSAHGATKDIIQFHRTYAAGGIDTYAVTFTDSSRVDGPFSETMTDTVSAVSNGVATMNVVTSNGTRSPKGHLTSTTEFNSQMQTTFGSNGIPAVPNFPSLNVRDALFLCMQGLKAVDNRGGVAVVFPAVTAPGPAPAGFTGQSADLVERSGRIYSVNGRVLSANGAVVYTITTNFAYIDANAVVKKADITIIQGTQTVTAKFVRTSP